MPFSSALQMGSKGFLEFRQKRFSIAFVYVLFSRERSPRGDQGLKTCLLALISNISTTTHLFSSICVFVSRESIEVGLEIRSEASVTAAFLDCTGTLSMVISRSSLLFFGWGCIKIIHNFLILFILRTF